MLLSQLDKLEPKYKTHKQAAKESKARVQSKMKYNQAK